MDDRLKDRIAVITGANQGIGKAIAQRFAASGARVVCADMNPAGDIAAALNTQYGAEDRALYVRCDVTDPASVEALIAEAAAWGGGRVDIACNFAGAIFGGTAARAHELPVDAFDRTLAVNTRGVWLSCKYELAQMLRQEPRAPNARGDRTRGWIVNAASIYGLIGAGTCSHYTASKHAVVGMTKEMAIDYSKDRIHINCVCPGWIRTAFLPKEQEILDGAKMRHPWGELGNAEDVANAVLFLCSDDNTWCAGTALVVDGGYTAM